MTLSRCGFEVMRGMKERQRFVDVAKQLTGRSKLFRYNGGSYSRGDRGDGLVDVGYTNPEHELIVHNEMAYVRDYPTYIGFLCEKPARIGGETLLVDGRDVVNALSEPSRKLLTDEPLTYSQIYGNETLAYESRNDYMALWQDVFDVEEKAAAEHEASLLGYQVEWSNEDEMEVRFTRPAMLDVDGETSVFDQIICCNKKHCHAVTSDGRPHFHVTLANGDEIPDAVLLELEELTAEHTQVLELAKGDAVIVDNRRVKHGRKAYEGDREMTVLLLS